MTEERTIYEIDDQPPADPPAGGELDARELAIEVLILEMKWRAWRDLAVWILLAWMKERENDGRE